MQETAKTELLDAIARFSCKRDGELSEFLNLRAFDYESKRKSRTYFLFDFAELAKGHLEIAGYFTVAPQVLHIPDVLSNNQRKILDGISGKRHGQKIESFPAVLIGQLAKNDPYREMVTGTEILDYAINIISKATDIIGGRIIMVETKTAVPALLDFYIRNGFKFISSDEITGLSQLVYTL